MEFGYKFIGWSVDVPELITLENGDNVSAVQIEKGKNPSYAVDVTVVKQGHEVITRFVDVSGLDIANQEKGTVNVKISKIMNLFVQL